MTDNSPVVRWRRRGYKETHGRNRLVRWHLVTETLSDTHGRTGCGLRYPRATAEYGTIADGELCRNCLRALGGIVPGDIAA